MLYFIALLSLALLQRVQGTLIWLNQIILGIDFLGQDSLNIIHLQVLQDRMLLPLHINVTHFFPCDALFIQKDIFGVPDNHS